MPVSFRGMVRWWGEDSPGGLAVGEQVAAGAERAAPSTACHRLPANCWRPLLLLAVEFHQQISRVGVPLVGEAPEFVEVAPFAGEFDELIDRGAIPGLGEVAQHVQVASLGGKFDELIGGGRVALVGEATQFIDIAQFAGELNQFVDRILVAVFGPRSKDRQIRLGHRGPPLRLNGMGAHLRFSARTHRRCHRLG